MGSESGEALLPFEEASQSAISQTFQSTANLSKLLPTGTVLAFQILSPVLTNAGSCCPANRIMSAGLLALCSLLCFALSFTDSFRDSAGTVRYGLATFTGMWVIDGSEQLPPVRAAAFRVRFIDFAHGFMSVAVFTAVALLDRNSVSCFYPVLTGGAAQVVSGLPVAIGVLASAFFLTFPSTRHGIGFPLSPH